MIKTSTLSFIALALCVLTAAFIRRDDVPPDKLVISLQRWTDSTPRKKIHILLIPIILNQQLKSLINLN